MKSITGNQSVQPTSKSNPSKGAVKPLPKPPKASEVRSLRKG